VRVRSAAAAEEIAFLWPTFPWPATLLPVKQACCGARERFVGFCEAADAAPQDAALTWRAVEAFATWCDLEREGWVAYWAWRRADWPRQSPVRADGRDAADDGEGR
jgi:hypothetical protein